MAASPSNRSTDFRSAWDVCFDIRVEPETKRTETKNKRFIFAFSTQPNVR